MISKQLFISGMIVLLIFSAATTTADILKTKLYIPELEVKCGQSVQLPVKIDPVDRLAGVKLVLEYDAKLFKFKKVEKTKQSESLMHVVNDRNPGKLIIVMAGARGISGKDIPIMLIHLMALPGISEKMISRIKITEIELMTDTLEEISSELSDTQITILPSTLSAGNE